MNDLCEKILKVLVVEMTDITGRSVINHFSQKIGKDAMTLERADLPKFSKALLESIFLFSDPEKARRISREMKALASE